MFINLFKNIPQSKLINTAGATATKNNASKVPGSPTKTKADSKNIVPLTKVPTGNITIETIVS